MSDLDNGNGNPVYTYDWDTAFAVPISIVNQAIQDYRSSPKNFFQACECMEISGNFSDWQITEGGDGREIHILLPMRNIVFQNKTANKVLKIDSGEAVISIQLHFIPHTDLRMDESNGDPYKLVVRHQSDNSEDPVAFLVTSRYSEGLGTVAKAIIDELLIEWCVNHLADFSHTFAVVNLNRMVDQKQWGFLAPNYVSYAYIDRGSSDDSVLAVLCMTANRTGKDLNEQISPYAIPKGSKAGFLISQRITLFDLICPAVCVAYPNLTQVDFELSSDGTMLIMKNGLSVDLKPVIHNGVTYYPKLTSLSITAREQTIQIDSSTITDISPGIKATCTATHWYNLKLGESRNGQTLLFEESKNASIVHNINQAPGLIITEIIIGIVAAIALIILTILTEGTALILGGLVIGLLAGATVIIPAVIEIVNKDVSPSVDLLLMNTVEPIKWTGCNVFKLDSAGLNVSLQLGGNMLSV